MLDRKIATRSEVGIRQSLNVMDNIETICSPEQRHRRVVGGDLGIIGHLKDRDIGRVGKNHVKG